MNAPSDFLGLSNIVRVFRTAIDGKPKMGLAKRQKRMEVKDFFKMPPPPPANWNWRTGANSLGNIADFAMHGSVWRRGVQLFLAECRFGPAALGKAQWFWHYGRCMYRGIIRPPPNSIRLAQADVVGRQPMRTAVSRRRISKFVSLNGSHRPVEPQQPLEMIVAANVIASNVSELVFPRSMRVAAKRKRNSILPSV